MSIYLFVVDGLGIWNDNEVSTYKKLMEKCKNEDDIVPFLRKVGLKEAVEGKGNLMLPKSVIAGSLEGHREMMGIVESEQYDICESSLPSEIIDLVYNKTKIKCIGNVVGRGRCLIPKYAPLLGYKDIILYLGLDSTISLAYKEVDFDVNIIENYANILMETLYQNKIRIRKIITRGFDFNFKKVLIRKEIFKKINLNSKIYGLSFHKVFINNKIHDILKLNSAEIIDCNNDNECIEYLSNINPNPNSLYFINFPNFDFFAHQGKKEMCIRTLNSFDKFLEGFWKKIQKDDYIIITSDHGVKFIDSDLSSAHVLERVAFLCVDKYGYYSFKGTAKGYKHVYRTIKMIQDGKKIKGSYQKL